jgi:hypothetical protein
MVEDLGAVDETIGNHFSAFSVVKLTGAVSYNDCWPHVSFMETMNC